MRRFGGIVIVCFCLYQAPVSSVARGEDPPAKIDKPKDAFEIAERLQKYPKESTFLPEIRFKLFLEMFQDATGIPMIVDLKSFGDPNSARDTLNELFLPSCDHRFSFEYHLSLACEQGGFAFMIEKEHIRLISAEAKQLLDGETRELPNLYRRTPKAPPIVAKEDAPVISRQKQLYKLLPSVTAKFEDVPLKEIVEKFQERSGRTILLTGAAQEQADTKISVTFLNVPFETALQTIGELTNLQPAKNGNVVLFVTPERFSELNAQKPNPLAEEPKQLPGREELLAEIEKLKRELTEKKEK